MHPKELINDTLVVNLSHTNPLSQNIANPLSPHTNPYTLIMLEKTKFNIKKPPFNTQQSPRKRLKKFKKNKKKTLSHKIVIKDQNREAPTSSTQTKPKMSQTTGSVK